MEGWLQPLLAADRKMLSSQFTSMVSGMHNVLIMVSGTRLKVTIICRYDFSVKHFASTNFCDLHAQSRLILMFVVHIVMFASTKFCVFGPIRKNIKCQYPQKLVTLRQIMVCTHTVNIYVKVGRFIYLCPLPIQMILLVAKPLMKLGVVKRQGCHVALVLMIFTNLIDKGD